MVFFACEGCGESLKKNQVEKHKFRCRSAGSYSCVDCQKTFHGEEYAAHIKCITESEKYGGAGFVAKERKGEKKQASWTDKVQDAIASCKPSDGRLRDLLQKISGYDNIPRKEKKFINFLGNSFRTSYPI